MLFICMMKQERAKKNKPASTANPDLTLLGKRIKELRLRKGYTSYETFAFEHEFPRALYGNWEKGRNITYLNLLKVIRALDISPSEFFKGIS